MTDQKIKKILRKFEENYITIDLEVVEDLPVENDRYKLGMKMNSEDDKLAVRKRKGKKTPKEDNNLRKLKNEEEKEMAGSQDDGYPEVRITQGIPRTRSELATKLFGIFDLKQSGGTTSNSCDNNVNVL